ncbi:methionine aminopeptidase [Bacillus solitudinis]|uniref:methionine aminopeptidase n=1 Tax=Bacillus solitudinis TaxID=2014074 RepID=UPI000C242088|nr:methionine aminopeptidase [Bacillus solitudinis]
MGFFNAIRQWTETRKSKRIADFELEGTCPNCQGRGFNMLESEIMMGSFNDCTGCRGSGSFSDWAETNY